MKKTILTIVLATLCLISRTNAQQNKILSGTVTTAQTGKPLPGATATIDQNTTVLTDEKGDFSVRTSKPIGLIRISYTGYQTVQISYRTDSATNYSIKLIRSEQSLSEVTIVSTGYQSIPKERATGSFTQIDAKTLNRNVGINILDRLEAVSSGVILNKGLAQATNNSKLSVRGRSTIFANAEPLIVLDGFPFEGTIDQLNPADISSITILKDAAAASIWGTRASNGVIVLTSKNGRFNKPLSVEVSSTLTISAKPDLFYSPVVSSSDYIDLESFLYNKGYYTDDIDRKYSPVSQAIEIFIKRQSGEISAADSANQINALKQQDIRKEMQRDLIRPQVYQQYQMNLNGGGAANQYYFSAGYDKNLENQVSGKYDRLTLNANNSYQLLKNKLKISGQINFSSGTAQSKYDSYLPYSPYDRIASENGQSLAVTAALRQSYLDTAGKGKLIDWNYRPLDELNPNQADHRIHYKINAGLEYRILPELVASGAYQYLNENGDIRRNFKQQDYYTRNLVNRFTSISGSTVDRAIPLGGILQSDDQQIRSKILRFQLSYNTTIATDHQISAIAGYEGNDGRINKTGLTLYGYDPETATNGNNLINPNNYYPYYYDPGNSEQIMTAPQQINFINITQSFYTNAAYTYKNRYTLSASARKDESNLFGVKANQKGVPLWSAGILWNIAREPFYNTQWLSKLNIRATYGYNGNTDKIVSGFLTVVNYGQNNLFGSNYAQILNPPNPSLSWEKVKTWNLGLDISSKDNRVSGSIDLYHKDGEDLIGNSPIAMQTGITAFKGNTANLRTKGIDLLISSHNLTGKLQWQSSLLFNYTSDKVTGYIAKQGSNLDIVSGNYNNPLEGFPYNAVFTFPSAGLDTTGAPQGYLNGTISKDYAAIIRTQKPSELKYHGSAAPVYFGSLINTFSYADFELSVNISYKLDYYFRRSQVFSGSLYTYRMDGYADRWQQPGDEARTRIPSLVYPADINANSFFQNSEDLIEKGDHIRLQDIRLAYGYS